MFKKVLSIALLAGVLSIPALAQDSNDWRYKVGVGFSNQNAYGENIQGWNAFGQVRVLKYERFALHGLLDGGGNYENGAYFHQVTAGPQLSATFGKLEPFVRGTVGATRFTAGGFKSTKFTTSVGGGLDVNLGRFFGSPGTVDFQYIDDTGVRFTRYTARVGVRF